MARRRQRLRTSRSLSRVHSVPTALQPWISPGWVSTEIAEDYIAKHGKSSVVADIPIGEIATPSEIAELVCFVLRPSQASLNGATLDVNGGSYIR
ncbi:SDR family oxidoreductase [Paraburkholderia sp. JPY419]